MIPLPDGIEAQIRDYIAQNLLFCEEGYSYSDEASFLDEDIVNSIGMLELVAFVEENYGISVADREIVPANFDSVCKLAAYVRRKAEATR
jgi:acyl carrier protein